MSFVIIRIPKRDPKKIITKLNTNMVQGSAGRARIRKVPNPTYRFAAIIEENRSPISLPNSSINPLLNPIKLFNAIKRRASTSKNSTTDINLL